MRLIAIWGMVLAAVGGYAQTKVDLMNQGRNVDFSQAGSTRPVKTGVSLPATCATGELFFKSDAAPGSNVYGCTSTNVWSLQSSSGGGGEVSILEAGLLDSQTLQIGSNCSATKPCNVRFGNTVFSFTQPATASISAGTGTGYFFVTPAGTLVAGHTMTVTCAGGCVAESGVTGFPIDSIPLFAWAATSGAWNATGTDARAFLSTRNVSVGMGLASVHVAGQLTLSIDTAVVGVRVAVPATSTDPCQAGWWALDLSYYYVCVETDNWRRMGLGSW